ncbi:hypothetical protein [Arsenicibacter rosenii]|uniref:Uncharacterized protein n=1 Tax=Arsenicibacter rosenii TaxID=1750698 RepID=A0A1S2VM25_9BACT|nr:hypothetical protein [Arsenicibacter rosenii]OIN59821.1 hypothetical protein BLX24_08155 [Arsenicibacter rosenii]
MADTDLLPPGIQLNYTSESLPFFDKGLNRRGGKVANASTLISTRSENGPNVPDSYRMDAVEFWQTAPGQWKTLAGGGLSGNQWFYVATVDARAGGSLSQVQISVRGLAADSTNLAVLFSVKTRGGIDVIEHLNGPATLESRSVFCELREGPVMQLVAGREKNPDGSDAVDTAGNYIPVIINVPTYRVYLRTAGITVLQAQITNGINVLAEEALADTVFELLTAAPSGTKVYDTASKRPEFWTPNEGFTFTQDYNIILGNSWLQMPGFESAVVRAFRQGRLKMVFLTGMINGGNLAPGTVIGNIPADSELRPTTEIFRDLNFTEGGTLTVSAPANEYSTGTAPISAGTVFRIPTQGCIQISPNGNIAIKSVPIGASWLSLACTPWWITT